MNKFERISAALQSDKTDRIPVSLWMHFSHIDQNIHHLAEEQVAFARKYDFDFIKLMPFGLYGVQDYGAKLKFFNQINKPPLVEEYGIQKVSDWEKIEPLAGNFATLGRQVELARRVGELSQGEFPFIQTIFSPLTTARKLAGDRIIEDAKTDPALFHRALSAITETTINFVRANIDAGVSGFFFATQCANQAFMSEEEYNEWGTPFDLAVIRAYHNHTFFNVAHIHGDGGFFKLVADYPVNCLSWHDRWSTPTLAQARSLSDKCFLGGIREIPFLGKNGEIIRPSILVDGSQNEIFNHIREAIDQVDGRGLILGPGCVLDQLSRPENIKAVRFAAEQ